MKILFAGTPEIVVPVLETCHARVDVVGVLCAPDAAVGRGRSLQKPPAALKAIELGLPVFQPERITREAQEILTSGHPDLLVCFAYGKIFRPSFLARFPLGGINIHPSLLPELRGPSPIQSAIALRKPKTGISIQQLADEMDAGDILLQEEILLDGRETAGSLSDRVARTSAVMISDALDRISDGTAEFIPQKHDMISYCSLLDREWSHIDWNESAQDIDALVRANCPAPGAYTHAEGKQLTILEAEYHAETGSGQPGTVFAVDKKRGILVQTGDGILAIQMLQLQSKRAMPFKDFLNGYRNFIGITLGGTE